MTRYNKNKLASDSAPTLPEAYYQVAKKRWGLTAVVMGLIVFAPLLGFAATTVGAMTSVGLTTSFTLGVLIASGLFAGFVVTGLGLALWQGKGFYALGKSREKNQIAQLEKLDRKIAELKKPWIIESNDPKLLAVMEYLYTHSKTLSIDNYKELRAFHALYEHRGGVRFTFEDFKSLSQRLEALHQQKEGIDVSIEDYDVIIRQFAKDRIQRARPVQFATNKSEAKKARRVMLRKGLLILGRVFLASTIVSFMLMSSLAALVVGGFVTTTAVGTLAALTTICLITGAFGLITTISMGVVLKHLGKRAKQIRGKKEKKLALKEERCQIEDLKKDAALLKNMTEELSSQAVALGAVKSLAPQETLVARLKDESPIDLGVDVEIVEPSSKRIHFFNAMITAVTTFAPVMAVGSGVVGAVISMGIAMGASVLVVALVSTGILGAVGVIAVGLAAVFGIATYKQTQGEENLKIAQVAKLSQVTADLETKLKGLNTQDYAPLLTLLEIFELSDDSQSKQSDELINQLFRSYQAKGGKELESKDLVELYKGLMIQKAKQEHNSSLSDHQCRVNTIRVWAQSQITDDKINLLEIKQKNAHLENPKKPSAIFDPNVLLPARTSHSISLVSFALLSAGFTAVMAVSLFGVTISPLVIALGFLTLSSVCAGLGVGAAIIAKRLLNKDRELTDKIKQLKSGSNEEKEASKNINDLKGELARVTDLNNECGRIGTLLKETHKEQRAASNSKRFNEWTDSKEFAEHKASRCSTGGVSSGIFAAQRMKGFTDELSSSHISHQCNSSRAASGR